MKKGVEIGNYEEERRYHFLVVIREISAGLFFTIREAAIYHVTPPFRQQ